MGTRRKWVLCVLASIMITLVLTGWVAQVRSQEKYPTRAIDLICPFAAGGGADILSRLVASFASKNLGVPVNVVDKPGGNSIPGNLEVYQAPKDGYTLMGDCQTSCSMLEAGGMKLPFKVMDRTFIALIATGPSIFIVPSTSSIKNLKDLEAEIKRDPGNFKWSSFGTGSTPDFVMRTFLKEIGVDVLKTKPVMCRGGSEAATLVSGGHILLGTASPATFIAVTKAGTARAIAVTGKKRLPDYPNADPAEEQGYPSVSQHMWWMGITGPPNLPSFVVDTWTNALGKVVKNQEFVSKLEDLGYALFFVTSLEAKKHVENEIGALKKAWE